MILRQQKYRMDARLLLSDYHFGYGGKGTLHRKESQIMFKKNKNNPL
tara:strand:- start:2 stop:142 length:141 start_codon:yes stop_codon:yes gene_type:complete